MNRCMQKRCAALTPPHGHSQATCVQIVLIAQNIPLKGWRGTGAEEVKECKLVPLTPPHTDQPSRDRDHQLHVCLKSKGVDMHPLPNLKLPSFPTRYTEPMKNYAL